MAYDVCVIGSGAGGGSVAWRLASQGYKVVVLERGPRFLRTDYLKDEVIQQRRPTFKPRIANQPVEKQWYDFASKSWRSTQTTEYYNGTLVGGSSELMSGFFYRLKPADFNPLSTHGPIAHANVADWPIGYDDLEPYYDMVEKLVGVSGRVTPLPEHLADRRSSPDFPMPPTREHYFAGLIDRECKAAGLNPMPLPRAVLSVTDNARFPGRKACDYNGYCGSYACQTGAKGAAGAAFIPRAESTGNCEVRSRALVTELVTDSTGEHIVEARYIDRHDKPQSVRAGTFVVACQAIESARLLLKSRGPKHKRGLANSSGQVGQNLVSSAFGAGWGEFDYKSNPMLWDEKANPFINRSLQDHYTREGTPHAGGTINFLLMHPNPIYASTYQTFWDQTQVKEMPDVRGNRTKERVPLWGTALKDRLAHYFTEVEHLKFEVFGNWLPTDWCRVELSDTVKDKWGQPVARVKQYSHKTTIENAKWMVDRGVELLNRMGAKNVRSAPVWGTPSTNLLAGTCRFGNDPKSSVLNRDCRAHDVNNLYVTDGSFMPGGGRVPFTFTIYANALRCADAIITSLGGKPK